MELEGVELEHVLIGLGMGVLGLYHGWLVFTIRHNPKRTVIGLNAESRHQWVFSMMADPLKNGVLIVQTIRNNIMASTLLATTAITLCSLISVYVSNESNSNHNSLSSSSSSQLLNVGDRTPIASSLKYFAILFCFLVAFLCNVQCIRYYAHVSFLATLPTSKDRRESIEYVVANLNRGCLFWSLGLRAFYLSFPLFLWLFGAIPMFICCCVMAFLLYFLDTTSSVTRQLHSHSFIEDPKANDVSFRRPFAKVLPVYNRAGFPCTRSIQLGKFSFLWLPFPISICFSIT
ncbi:uncharacterized protein LOC114295200 isoform X1 [Camellia sinensis]|uniref:uncharacterized protein LOC114295200 isoform X1 n=1 Tax=Camellia sinensis TaxID=4442 RepID=UPI001035CC4E|nr:uncharacterized protein LOC114295200 isoform X1 [Camellia sinensis]